MTSNIAIKEFSQNPLRVTFDQWTQKRDLPWLSTNAGATVIPFQNWFHFKEAFAPELIARAIDKSRIPVQRCLDPFGGSGTTALACQFLGVHPITIEVNPFLAQLIAAKLETYDPDLLARDLHLIVERASKQHLDKIESFIKNLPPTFIEPGMKGRWIFDSPVAFRIVSIYLAIEELSDERHKQLFLILLGGILTESSNVVISGKGRRYRQGWTEKRRESHQVDKLFCDSARRAIVDIHRYSGRDCSTFEVTCADCREKLEENLSCDLAIFSPPYPNSFDYTDVYNVELWMLGYLLDSESNKTLRKSTLSSHVQVSRQFDPAPLASPTLNRTIEQLNAVKAKLWSPHIPNMVGGYFADMNHVLDNIQTCMTAKGSAWLVVGDSRYGDIQIETAEIISELAASMGWNVDVSEPFRSMRASPQQGGREELAESLVVISKL